MIKHGQEAKSHSRRVGRGRGIGPKHSPAVIKHGRTPKPHSRRVVRARGEAPSTLPQEAPTRPGIGAQPQRGGGQGGDRRSHTHESSKIVGIGSKGKRELRGRNRRFFPRGRAHVSTPALRGKARPKALGGNVRSAYGRSNLGAETGETALILALAGGRSSRSPQSECQREAFSVRLYRPPW